MTRHELIGEINNVLGQGDQLSIELFAVFKESNDVKKLNVHNEEIEHIQGLFINGIEVNILNAVGQGIVKVSEADERGNVVFEYDLDIPEGLGFLDEELNDETSVFSFSDDELAEIEYLLIKIGTEEHQLVLLKKLSPVEVFGRGGYLLWKSNQRFERFEDQVLRLTSSFNAIKVNGTLIFTELNLLERSLGFHDVIVREATSCMALVSDMNILDNVDGILELIEENTSFARKVLKIRSSPVITKAIPNAAIIAFTQTHPSLQRKMRYNDAGDRIILHTKRSKELFIKMLDDAFLMSQLTEEYYESLAKDTVSSEVEDILD